MLKRLLKGTSGIVYVDHVHAGHEAYAFAVAKGLEGIVAKRAGSAYVARRSDNWRKVKTPAGRERERDRFDR